jgi:3-demethoxyubiquinol 3-hydroxylase
MNLVDHWISAADDALRTLAGKPQHSRSTPQPQSVDAPALSDLDRKEVAALMRINHAGEVCAQALYSGQALVARSIETRALLENAAAEERDHLAWCEERLSQLGDRTSALNPLWYAGSFALGVASGLAGDRWSMGFLAETEKQVEAHLDSHLARVNPADAQTVAVLTQMREDERRHGKAGEAHGAARLPWAIKKAMALSSKVMTRTARYL